MLPVRMEIVDAGEQDMLDRARVEPHLQLRVGREAVRFADALHRAAVDRPAGDAAGDVRRAGGQRIPRKDDDLIERLDMGEAAVVSDREMLIEAMLEEGGGQIL